MRTTRILLVAAVLAVSSLPAAACIEPHVQIMASPGAAVVSPAGTTPSLADQGIVVGVMIQDCSLAPAVNFPAQDIFVASVAPTPAATCRNGSLADRDTDEMGYTTVSGVIAGGGWTEEGLRLHVSGIPCGEPLPIRLNSPDINGDLVVNLGDFSIFGQDYDTARFRSDFNHDGIVSLHDFSVFGQHYDERCP
jgi:hypothetical protein